MRLGKDKEAAAIASDLLERLDRAFMDIDFDLYAELLHVPHHIRTMHEVFDIRDQIQLSACFDHYCKLFKDYRAVTCKRIVKSAEFRAKQRIVTRYSVSHFDCDGKLVTPTTFTTSILMVINGKWRICGSDSNTRVTTGIGEAVENAVLRNTNAA